MEIKTKKHFNEIIKSLTEQILDEEDLTEFNTTASVGGQYMTPWRLLVVKKINTRKVKKIVIEKKLVNQLMKKI